MENFEHQMCRSLLRRASGAQVVEDDAYLPFVGRLATPVILSTENTTCWSQGEAKTKDRYVLSP